jgi:hypothetical protein
MMDRYLIDQATVEDDDLRIDVERSNFSGVTKQKAEDDALPTVMVLWGCWRRSGGGPEHRVTHLYLAGIPSPTVVLGRDDRADAGQGAGSRVARRERGARALVLHLPILV